MDTAPQPRSVSRRTLLGLAVPAALVVAWFAVKQGVRTHVDGVIQAAIGRPLAEFSLEDTTGRRWSRADLLGKRVVLHFFRSHCPTCDVEAPEYRAFEQAVGDQALVLHVITDRVMGFAPEQTARTVAEKAFRQPVLYADEAFMDALHKVEWSRVTPVTYLVDREGTIRTALRGRQVEATLHDQLATLP